MLFASVKHQVEFGGGGGGAGVGLEGAAAQAGDLCKSASNQTAL